VEHDEDGWNWMGRRRFHDSHGHEMRRKVDAGGRDPRAGDAITVLERHRHARRIEACRTAELAGRTIYVALTFLGEKRQDDWVTGRKREHPARLRAAARDFHHHSVEGRYIKLVPAKAARLHDAIEASPNKFVVDVFGNVPASLAFSLAIAQERHHFRGASAHPLGR